jgi:hypothetical protein
MRMGGGGAAPLARSRSTAATVSVPINFYGATINKEVDIERAAQLGAQMAARTFLDALNEDDRGGGAASNWRAS